MRKQASACGVRELTFDESTHERWNEWLSAKAASERAKRNEKRVGGRCPRHAMEENEGKRKRERNERKRKSAKKEQKGG